MDLPGLPYKFDEFSDVSAVVSVSSNHVCELFPHGLSDELPRLILKSLYLSIKDSTLRPLIRALERGLQISAVNRNDHGATIFSCDSFCAPHLQTQLKMFRVLRGLDYNYVSFANLPVSHYASSTPIAIDTISGNIDKLLLANRELISYQQEYLGAVPVEMRIEVDCEVSYALSHAMRALFDAVDDLNFLSVYISRFPFHELAYRDLSLTKKYTLQEILSGDQMFSRDVVALTKNNLWLLSWLLIKSNIAQTCCAMSFYNATNVFRYFCSQTNRIFRFFGPPSISLHDFGSDTQDFICITDNPASYANLTSPSCREQLRMLNLGPIAETAVKNLIYKRASGNIAHAYSPKAGNSEELSTIKLWIANSHQLNRKVLSLVSSSLDESTSALLSYAHEHIDLSHLTPSPFNSQEEWIFSTLDYLDLNHSEDISIIIRLHPRLGADRRGLPAAPCFQSFYERLQKRVSNNPNVLIIHPESEVSSYELGLLSDLILNGWSTLGLELAILGKPVTNAFYSCPFASGVLYNIHISCEPLATVCKYFDRVSFLISILQSNEVFPDISFLIRPTEAARALLAANLYGIVSLYDKYELQSQIAEPQLLTKKLFELISS